MRILIVEDNEKFAKKLYHDLFIHLSGLADNNTFDIITDDFSNLPNKRYDICFLDIDLAGDNGIELAKEIKHKGMSNIIVFVTAHHNLVYNSLSAQPYYFIRKKTYEEDIQILFGLLKESFSKKTLIALKSRGNKSVIQLEDIIYIEAIDHAIIIHTTGGQYNDSRPLKEFLQVASFHNLVQIHKSFAINLKFLMSYSSNSVTLIGNFVVNIGRSYKNDFIERYQKYLVEWLLLHA